MPGAPRMTVPVGGADHAGGLDALLRQAVEQRWPVGTSTLDGICRYALVPTGKLFRPLLLVDSALAVGGAVDAVLPAAVGAECGHVASLIHDDIIDGDDLRRGRASVHHRFGVADAIVAGDALIFDMFAGLAECGDRGVPGDRVVLALESVARAGLDLCRGQSLEAEICGGLTFDTDRYLTMVRLKTASFFRGACESGAILGGGTPAEVRALATYGDRLGVAFQIHDDLLAYTSDSGVTGKPGTSDVQNGRLTLPVILAYHRSAPSGQARIRTALASPGDVDEALATLGGVLSATGAVAAAARVARDHAAASREALRDVQRSPSRDRLVHIAELAIDRDR
jgi:geranylgeranyl pyrophosphate synthase